MASTTILNKKINILELIKQQIKGRTENTYEQVIVNKNENYITEKFDYENLLETTSFNIDLMEEFYKMSLEPVLICLEEQEQHYLKASELKSKYYDEYILKNQQLNQEKTIYRKKDNKVVYKKQPKQYIYRNGQLIENDIQEKNGFLSNVSSFFKNKIKLVKDSFSNRDIKRKRLLEEEEYQASTNYANATAMKQYIYDDVMGCLSILPTMNSEFWDSEIAQSFNEMIETYREELSEKEIDNMQINGTIASQIKKSFIKMMNQQFYGLKSYLNKLKTSYQKNKQVKLIMDYHQIDVMNLNAILNKDEIVKIAEYIQMLKMINYDLETMDIEDLTNLLIANPYLDMGYSKTRN